MARALAVLFGAGGVIVLLTLLLPHAADADEWGLALPALVVLIVTGVLLALGGRTSVLALQLFLVGGSLLITGDTGLESGMWVMLVGRSRSAAC